MICSLIPRVSVSLVCSGAAGSVPYDYAALFEAEALVAGAERRAALERLFLVLGAGAVDELDLHLETQPLHPDGQMVQDPLVVLVLGQGRCGHVARLAVDLFEAGGYRARLVQLVGHVSAEAFLGGRWLAVEAGALKHGQVIALSHQEIQRSPWVLEAARLGELDAPAPSEPYFGEILYLEKLGIFGEPRFYGWDRYVGHKEEVLSLCE
jgi:hypothetical protein